MIKDFFSPEGKIQQRKLFWILFGIIVLVWVTVGLPYSQDLAQKQFDTFNRASIRGRIAAMHSKKAGVGLRVNNQELDFYPVADQQLNGYQSFSDVAAVSDSIVKEAYADTLFLFTKNKVYKYTFKTE